MRMFDTPLPNLNGKSILITGGTGSFGKAFSAAILERWSPRRLIIFSRDETKQWEMSMEAPFAGNGAVRFFLGDVRDQDRLEMAMRDVDYVVHAAAQKHVTAAEYNPFECIKTNVHGAENIVGAAIRTGVKKVLALSTDKAVSPANLYGASKLAMEKIFVAGNNIRGTDGTTFSVVRYGNVLGSRGSIVPLFRRLILEGVDHLPITDDRMTRFWISLQQGVNFVLSSLELMHGGEIFVPKIPSMRIMDLAAVLAPNLPARIVGIRPGEKLHEAMLTSDEARSTLEMQDRFVVEPAMTWWTRQSFRDLGATPLPEGFSYVSNENSEWLSETRLLELLAQSFPGDQVLDRIGKPQA